MPLQRMDIQKLIDSTSNKEEKELLRVFPELLDSLRDMLETGDKDMLDAKTHFQEAAEYTLPQCKNVQALMFMKVFKELAKDSGEKELKLVRIVAWCFEMIYSSFKLIDELIFDKTVDADARPCYHRVTGTGIEASNDAFFVLCLMYMILQKYIADDSKLMAIESMFRYATKEMVIGQNLFLNTLHPQGKADFSLFTSDRYNTYVKYRTSHYSFYLPIKFAMYWVGLNDTDTLQRVERIALKLGHFAKVKEDYLNCYGNKEVFGKTGSNIEQNKMCWLIVTALNQADDKQKDILKANYGRPNENCISKVKAVYQDLDLTSTFRTFEKTAHRDLLEEISKMGDDLPKNFMFDIANNILNWEDTRYFFKC